MKERLGKVPQKPGVYLFKDERGQVIYVGKAKALRNRLRSYFQSPSQLLPKVRAMMAKVRDFDYVVTANEVEALILESNLIKSYQPRYNIMLRDDKSYPYLKVTMAEEYPRLVIAREKKDGVSRYFGPYSDVGALRQTIRLLTGIFPVRTCRTLRLGRRPCLKRDIGRCLAPCTGEISREEYMRVVADVCRFLEGDHAGLLAGLEEEMREAADKLEFEKAARLRDTIRAVEKVSEKQKVVLENPWELDVMAFAPVNREMLGLVFKVRAGRVVGKETFELRTVMGEGLKEIVAYFIQRYYSESPDLPREILIPVEPEGREVLETWLSEMKKARVTIKVPHRGTKRQLMVMAEENARLLAEEKERAGEALGVLVALAQVLSLETVPSRIECYDVSHLSGEGTVGSMAVLTEGKKDKSAYRRFNLGKDINDDYQALSEILRRRLTRGQEGDPAFLPMPDLVVIDGGLGQVNVAQRAMQEMGITVPVVGLAKKNEEIYFPSQREPLRLPRRHQALHLLQSLRDEAHRFAVTYQRTRRGHNIKQSELDRIAGIGEKRKMALLQAFGSVDAIKNATPEELSRVKGMNRSAAKRVFTFFNSKSGED